MVVFFHKNYSISPDVNKTKNYYFNYSTICIHIEHVNKIFECLLNSNKARTQSDIFAEHTILLLPLYIQ